MARSDSSDLPCRPGHSACDVEERRREARAWVVRLRPGIATTTDIADFKEWAGRSEEHARAFKEARALWGEIAVAARNVSERMPTAWADRGGSPAPLLERRALLRGAMAVAAVGVGFAIVRPPFGLWPSLPEVIASDYRTGKGERRQLALAERVSIELNTQTSIAVRDPHRIELLTGESTISSQAELVEVVAAKGRVLCSDATFCVRYDGNYVCVTCIAGQVDVNCGDRTITLKVDEQVRYSDAGLENPGSVNPETIVAWRNGYLLFHDAPLSEVVAEANRYRRGRIIVLNKALDRRLVNARFRLDQIDDLVPKLVNAFHATATTLPGGIVILS